MVFKIFNEDDELHSGVNFHISCKQDDEWVPIRATVSPASSEIYNLVVIPKGSNATEDTENYPVIGVITPYYVYDAQL